MPITRQQLVVTNKRSLRYPLDTPEKDYCVDPVKFSRSVAAEDIANFIATIHFESILPHA